MPVNVSLADTSNGLLLTTLILYALAMLCYASDFAFARHRVLADVTDAVASAEVPELVAAPELVTAGAGGRSLPASAVPASAGSSAAVHASPPGGRNADDAPASRWPSGFWLRLAFGLICS
jgi:hypothetical protein